ncbi:hypothetical protein AB0C89_02930 [Streptomyces sp. NPDC048491]|uniref:hypothetical protein n=1 Tax=Streptomyces sp. NPDC048491 TaxID=3157207 RepID=UPI003414028B
MSRTSERGWGQTVDGGRVRRVGLSRLLVLCAVLFGLFSMHGAPASAASGCHGDFTMAAPMGAPMSMGHTDMWGEHMGVRAASVTPPVSGELCVSTPARDRLPAAAAGLLALLGLVVLVGWGLVLGPRAPFAAARRGPPLHGRGLLLEVCVART